MPVRLLVAIAEGPATMVRAVTFEGVTAFRRAKSAQVLRCAPAVRPSRDAG